MLDFNFRFVIHSELIFACGESYRRGLLLSSGCAIVQLRYLERPSVITEMTWKFVQNP